MFKKKDVKKPKDISENNNSSSDEELSDNELFNVAGGQLFNTTFVEGKVYGTPGKGKALRLNRDEGRWEWQPS